MKPARNGPNLPCKDMVAIRRKIGLLGAFLAFSSGSFLQGAELPSKKTTFESAIQPILKANCVECHNDKTRKANLDLSTPEAVLRGSESGAIFKPGDPKKSLLYEQVHTGEMPRKRDPLSHHDIALIESWIKNGAKFQVQPQLAQKPPHQHDVIPIMLLRCTTCHGPQLTRGNLDLRTREGMLQGGTKGPAIVPGDPESSLAIQRIESEACPPKGQLLKYFVKRPTAAETKKLRDWIAAGAPEEDISPDVATTEPDPMVTEEDRQHWSFQPLGNPDPPEFADRQFSNPIDAFIYSKQQEKGLDFSPRAERLTLIRRAYFDLTGLPPTLAELDQWQNHSSPAWYEEMIHQLLLSPNYGERWGRYWLDVAGYADSEGGQSVDTIRDVAWKYRDYVIRAFNEDKPYNRFLHEQIAGDELAPHEDPKQVTDEVVDNLTATGFLRMGIDQTGSRTMNFVPERIGLISDAIDVVSAGVMGLSMKCARCHGHKYDPIPQRDYYRLKAIFQGAFDEHDWMSWKTRKLYAAPPQTVAKYKTVNPPLQSEIKELEKERGGAVSKLQNHYYKERWPKLTKEQQQEILAAVKVTPDRRDLRQVELVERYESYWRPTEEHLVQMHPKLGKTLDGIDSQLADLRRQLMPPLTIRALWDRGRPSPTYISIRGEHNQPGRLVGPGVPSALTDGKTPLDVKPPWPGANKTGRRLAFARWLTEPDHPLTARVMVNRVWKHHFGEGIVATLDNFGLQGTRPTHPELLDWLAREFVDSGWSVKHLHRIIMQSQTYQQVSTKTPERDAADPNNQLLSRMNMRRLNAEALRDSILFVSGRLDQSMYGAPEQVSVREDGLIMEEEEDGNYRRSIYLQLRRTEMPSLMDTFDYPQMEPNCIQRTTSTVSPQALMLNNNARIYGFSRSFAERVQKLTSDPKTQITTIYKLALSRLPSDQELTAGLTALTEFEQEWQSAGPNAKRNALGTYCHVLLNSAEFIYVD